MTRLCWEHILYHKRRRLVDKIIRLKKLPLAKQVLEEATTYQTKMIYKNYIRYGFRAIKGETVVKIVVASNGERGKKELYSIMFKSLKRQKQFCIDKHNQKIIREFKKKNQRPHLRLRR